MLEAFGLAGFAFAGDGFVGDGFVAAAGIQSSGGMAHFVRVAGDDAADGGDAGRCDVLLPAPGSQQDPQFGFAEVGELLAQLADFAAPVPGGAGFGSQGCAVVAGLAQCLFPAIKRSATDIKGITSSRCAMIREETEDFDALLSMFGSPLPKMP